LQWQDPSTAGKLQILRCAQDDNSQPECATVDTASVRDINTASVRDINTASARRCHRECPQRY